MKRHKSVFFTKNSKSILLSLIATLVLCCVLVCSFAGCSSSGGDTTDTTAAYEVDEETYVFGAGYSIGSINLEGMLYKDAKAQAEEECLTMIKDFTLTVKAGDKAYEFDKSSFSWDTNVEASLKKAAYHCDMVKAGKEEAKDMHYDLTFKVNETSVTEAAAAIAKEVDIEPVDANISVSGTEISFTDEKNGLLVDQDKLKGDMTAEIDKLSKGEKKEATVTAEIKEVAPKVTSDDLDNDVKLLSTATSYSTNTADGDHNMALALSACNGSVIKPGEIWSFNACTGDSNLTSNGYRGATVIVNGEFVQGVGGGICQASTVIYQAALKANLGVYERYCHYYKSSYADVGLDATIDYPSLDLKLQNNTEHPVYLQCYMDGATLYASFYGWQDPSFDEIKLSSWIYEENYAANYYRAAAQRTFYKDGKELYSEDLPNSEYGYYSTKPAKPTKPTKPTEATKPATTPEVPTDAPITTPPEPSEYPTTPVTPTTPDPTIIDSGTNAS